MLPKWTNFWLCDTISLTQGDNAWDLYEELAIDLEKPYMIKIPGTGQQECRWSH